MKIGVSMAICLAVILFTSTCYACPHGTRLSYYGGPCVTDPNAPPSTEELLNSILYLKSASAPLATENQIREVQILIAFWQAQDISPDNQQILDSAIQRYNSGDLTLARYQFGILGENEKNRHKIFNLSFNLTPIQDR